MKQNVQLWCGTHLIKRLESVGALFHFQIKTMEDRTMRKFNW